MGVLQERITSTKTGSITSIQAVYVPADDLDVYKRQMLTIVYLAQASEHAEEH